MPVDPKGPLADKGPPIPVISAEKFAQSKLPEIQYDGNHVSEPNGRKFNQNERKINQFLFDLLKILCYNICQLYSTQWHAYSGFVAFSYLSDRK